MSENEILKDLTKQQAVQLDVDAQKSGLPGLIQMELAGTRSAEFLRELILKKHKNSTKPFGDFRECINDLKDMKVLIVAGKGGNGGDGLVVARHVSNWGATAKIILLGRGIDMKGDARINYDIAKNFKYDIHEITEAKELEEIDFSDYHGVVDALFGTGLSRNIEGIPKLAIEKMNENSTAVKLALDNASGLNVDTGDIYGVCFKADATIAFAGGKIGVTANKEMSGDIKVVDISIPYFLYPQ